MLKLDFNNRKSVAYQLTVNAKYMTYTRHKHEQQKHKFLNVV